MIYKVGDKIKVLVDYYSGCMPNGCGPKIGDILTVVGERECTTRGNWIDDRTAEVREVNSYGNTEFALVEKLKTRFSVGDKVVSIKDTPQASEGFIGYVTLILSGQYGIHVTKEGEDGAKAFDEDELELLSAKQTPTPVEETVIDTAGPIKSDGGSSSYYDLPVPEWLLSELFDREIATEGKPYIKTEEIIAAFFANDFDLGNIIKCLVRVKGLQDKTGGKAGNSVDYECNKMKYSVEKIRGKR